MFRLHCKYLCKSYYTQGRDVCIPLVLPLFHCWEKCRGRLCWQSTELLTVHVPQQKHSVLSLQHYKRESLNNHQCVNWLRCDPQHWWTSHGVKYSCLLSSLRTLNQKCLMSLQFILITKNNFLGQLEQRISPSDLFLLCMVVKSVQFFFDMQ